MICVHYYMCCTHYSSILFVIISNRLVSMLIYNSSIALIFTDSFAGLAKQYKLAFTLPAPKEWADSALTYGYITIVAFLRYLLYIS